MIIGQFPDKNVNEAISRVAGISLDRGDSGEGEGFSIRGQGPDTTRVELDGMSVLNTGTGLSGGASNATTGRGSDLREIPAALVKSIDIVKGTTASMTEGSLGGTIKIETRTGLDFKKPFFQISASQQMNSLSKKWTPEISTIFSAKTKNGRLGVLGNINYSEFQTVSDIQQPQTSGNAGPGRFADFDQSSSKTFTYNPAVVDPTATAPNLYIGSLASPAYASLSPIQILTASAGGGDTCGLLCSLPGSFNGATQSDPGGQSAIGDCKHA